MAPTDVFASTAGRVLTAAVALAAGLLVAGLAGDVALADLGFAAGVGGLAVLVVWTTLGRPCVEVSDGTVVLRNVLRTVTLPWPVVVRAEVGWSLVVHTTSGRWTAWAAPRSGGAARRRTGRRDAGDARDPQDAGADRTAGPGGAGAVAVRRHPASAEAVAAAIDQRLADLRRAGHLDDADRVAAEHGIRPSVTWHTGTLVCAALLVAAAVATRLG